MNRKKIYKLLSSTISGLYLINTMSVFAQEPTIEISTASTEESSSQNNDTVGGPTDVVEDAIDSANTEEGSIKGEVNKTEDDKEEVNDVYIEEDKDILNKDVIKEENLSAESLEIKDKLNEENTSVGYLENNNQTNVAPFILTASPILYEPTINYKDGLVSIADNGLIPGTMDVIESFDNPSDIKFNFSNSNWIIEDGVMKSPTTSFITTNNLEIESDFNAEITIKVRVSSASGNTGSIYVNSNKVFTQSGVNNDNFTTIKSDLKKGKNKIEFSYYKSSSTTQGLDAMIIDEITITSEYHSPTSDSLEYRINGGDWTSYTEPFACDKGSKVEARSLYSSYYSSISVENLDVVDVPDINLVKAINKVLGKSELSTTIYTNELGYMGAKLDVSNSNINDLTGLENFTNIVELVIDGNEVVDLLPIKNMTNLKVISAKNNKVESIEPISNLTNLITIDFEGNVISDISPISSLTNLNTVRFKNNILTDKSAIDVISNMGLLEEVYLTLDMPTLALKIGENNSFNNVKNLNLDYSNFSSISVSRANNLKYFRIPSSVVGNIDVDNCNFIETLNFNYIKANDVSIKNVTSKLYISMTEGNVNLLSVTDCTNFDNLAIQRSVLNNLFLENLSSGTYLYVTIDGVVAENVTLSNLKPVKNSSLNSSDVKIGTMIIKNTSYSNVNMVSSHIGKLDMSENVTIDSISLYSFQTASELNLGDANFKEVYSNNMKAKSLILKSSPRITYISLDGLISENVEIENCDLLNSVSIPNGKVDNVSARNLNSLKTFDITAINSNSCVVENCPSLTTLTNTYNTNKGVIKSLTLRNLNSMTELKFPKYDIENIDINTCDNVSNIDLSQNNIKDISQIKLLNSLASIDVSDNAITDISPLKSIASLNINDIEALNQSLALNDIFVKEGTIEIDIPNIIDYSGDIISVKQISDKTKTGINKLNLGEYTEGVYDKIIELESATSKYSVNISQKITVDGTAPTLSIVPSESKWTNKNVVLNITAEDAFSDIDYIKLPNGDIVKSSTYTFEVECNGEYEFEAVDLAGNVATEKIVIDNIDKVNPYLNTSVLYNTNKTEAVVKIQAKDDLSGILSVTLPDGKVLNQDEMSFMVNKNGKYNVLIIDAAGNAYTETVVIDNLKVINDNNDAPDSIIDKNEMPNTGGLLPLIILTSIASLIGGLLSIKKKNND